MLERSSEVNALKELLREYNEYPERRKAVSAEIEQRFRRPVAILVLDTCGFTRTVQSLGIIHFLALIERLDRLITPIVERTGGRLLKREADNIFAVFKSVESAVECADQILFTVRAANEPLPAADEIDVSLGLGYGEVIQVGENDLFGDEMNLACKLGEDLAERHELLLTPAARQALEDTDRWHFEAAEYSISGLNLHAFRLIPGAVPG
jgi:class 3 adenylate cyclase